jgi:hypothetical protein
LQRHKLHQVELLQKLQVRVQDLVELAAAKAHLCFVGQQVHLLS